MTAPIKTTPREEWEITDEQMMLAFDDYEYALGWLTRYCVAFEFCADFDGDRPSPDVMARYLQDMARLGCAVGNNSPDGFQRYSFSLAEGDCPKQVYDRIVAAKKLIPVPDIEHMEGYVKPYKYVGLDTEFWACRAMPSHFIKRELTGTGNTPEEAKDDLRRSLKIAIRGRAACAEERP